MLPQHLVGWGDWGSAMYALHFESQGSRMLLGWKEINGGEKDGIRFVFFVFDKKCIVVWMIVMFSGPSCVGMSQPFSFLSTATKILRRASSIPPHWDDNFWALSPALIHPRSLLVMFFSPHLHWNGVWWSSHEKNTNLGGHPSLSYYFALYHRRDEGLRISKAAPFFL